MNAYELADEIENFYKHHNQPYLLIQLQSILRQQADDKDRALRVLKEVDGVLLDYIEQLEKKPMTTLAHGRGVALAVKYMIAVLEDGK